MQYKKIIPPDILKPFVRYLWVLEADVNDDVPKTFGALADGCPGIMFNRSGNGPFSDEGRKSLPGVLLYGQTLQPTIIHAPGKFSITGVCFYPDALKSVFGIDAHELTASCVDITLLLAKKDKALPEQLLNATTIDEQINLLSAYFLQLANKNEMRNDGLTKQIVSKIIHARGDISLKEIQTTFKLSERTFERRFKDAVGISPKLYARVCRFQEALQQLKKNNYDKLSDIAYENGYADQSHFIRSFKEFAGASPNEFRKGSVEIGENFQLLKKDRI